jgi:hypothetical protein
MAIFTGIFLLLSPKYLMMKRYVDIVSSNKADTFEYKLVYNLN